MHDADGQRAVLLDAIAVVQFEGRKSFVAGCVAHVRTAHMDAEGRDVWIL